MTSRHPAPSPVATAAKLPPPPLLWGGEATNPHHPVHPVSKVPIRASPVRARRPEYRSPQSTISEFQSAPRPCGRGDTVAEYFGAWLESFQSAPRPCGRGDLRETGGGDWAGTFQSAPRPCGRGDLLAALNSGQPDAFQSAPRPCGRGDGPAVARAAHGYPVSIRASPVRARRHQVKRRGWL